MARFVCLVFDSPLGQQHERQPEGCLFESAKSASSEKSALIRGSDKYANLFGLHQPQRICLREAQRAHFAH